MSAEEAPSVVQTPGGLSVSYRGRLLYSRNDPERLPRRLAAACDPEPARLHLVASPLLWYGLPELLERMGKGSAILCVEADPALAELALRSAPPGLLAGGKVAFIASASPEAVVAEARKLGSFRACAPIALSGGESLNACLYRRMAELVASEIDRSWRNRASLMSMGRLWAKNAFDNMAALAEIAPEPLPRFPGATAVCGAGPSLEEALPFLARNRESLSVVACDTALGSLLAYGIEPDLAVCLEAQAHNLADFTPLGSLPLRLCGDLSSHPAGFRAVRGPKHLSLVRITDSPFLERASGALSRAAIPFLPMPPLGSVGVHAVHLARALSDGPVLALGLDFSFEPGKTHARRTPTLLAEERKLDRLTRWPGQFAASFRDRSRPAPCPPLADGRALLSDPVLLSYAGLLSGAAGEPGAALYDARGRGPSIGAPRVDLAAAEALARASAGRFRDVPAAAGRVVARERAERAAAAFLAEEAALLNALYDIMKGRPANFRGASLGRAELPGLVAEADYLYWGFPDAERSLGLPQDFLNRLLPELDWWAARIARIRASGPA